MKAIKFIFVSAVVVAIAGAVTVWVAGIERPPRASRVIHTRPGTPAMAHSVLQSDLALPRSVHTSPRTLYAFVAERAGVEAFRVGDGGPVRVVGEAEPEIAAAMAGRFTARDSSASGTETVVNLRWRNRRTSDVAWCSTPVTRGTLVAEIAGPKGTAVVSADLDEKRWLDAVERAGDMPGEYVIARSAEVATTEGQACEDARRAAVDALVTRLSATALGRRGGGHVSEQAIRHQAEGGIQGGRMIVDQCAVRVDRAYGSIWSAAVLVRADDETLDSLARSAILSTRETRQTRAGAAVALAGMLSVLGLVYAVANSATRGYFRSTLRGVTLCLAAAGAAVVFLLVA